MLCDFVFLRTVLFSQKNSVLSIDSRVGSRACSRSRVHSSRCVNLKTRSLSFFFIFSTKISFCVKISVVRIRIDCIDCLGFVIFVKMIKNLFFLKIFQFDLTVFIIFKIIFKLSFILFLMSSGIFIFLRNLF